MERRAFVESIEAEIAGELVNFTIRSGAAVVLSCMSRSGAVKAAYDILAAVESDTGGEVIAFPRVSVGELCA